MLDKVTAKWKAVLPYGKHEKDWMLGRAPLLNAQIQH